MKTTSIPGSDPTTGDQLDFHSFIVDFAVKVPKGTLKLRGLERESFLAVCMAMGQTGWDWTTGEDFGLSWRDTIAPLAQVNKTTAYKVRDALIEWGVLRKVGQLTGTGYSGRTSLYSFHRSDFLNAVVSGNKVLSQSGTSTEGLKQAQASGYRNEVPSHSRTSTGSEVPFEGIEVPLGTIEVPFEGNEVPLQSGTYITTNRTTNRTIDRKVFDIDRASSAFETYSGFNETSESLKNKTEVPLQSRTSTEAPTHPCAECSKPIPDDRPWQIFCDECRRSISDTNTTTLAESDGSEHNHLSQEEGNEYTKEDIDW